MNLLETEYSFLTPTWQLPSIGTSTFYPTATTGLSYMPTSKILPDTSNSRYIPPNSTRRNAPLPAKQQAHVRQVQPASIQHSIDQIRINDYSNDILDINDQSDTRRKPNPSQTVQKRVQIIDYNHQTPSVDHISERDSYNSYSPDTSMPIDKTRARRDQNDEKSDAARPNLEQTTNFNVHDYLYGLSAPDPGSYVNAYKNQQRRSDHEKSHRKTFVNEYKTFTKNGGFGPAFGNKDYQSYEERVEAEKKRKTYSQHVRENNQFKIEEHKRMQHNSGQQNRTQTIQPAKFRHPNAVRSNFQSAQEVREFERKIKREHDAHCKCSLHANSQHSSA